MSSRWIRAASGAPFTAIAASILVLTAGCSAGSSPGGIRASPSGSPPASLPAAETGRVIARSPVGNGPAFAAEDQKTQTLYVTNYSDGTVSVVDMAQCNSHRTTGCARTWPVITVGSNPLGIAVDQATDTVYVANSGDGTVSVINGAACHSGDTSGCRRRPAVVRAGAFAAAVVVDPITNVVFVANQDTHPGTVSVIDGSSCDGSHPSGCAGQPFATVNVGGGPSGIGIDPVTDTVYVANAAEDSNGVPLPDGDTLSVINGATCAITSKTGCEPVATVRVGADPADIAVDPITNTIYAANTYDNTNAQRGTVSVVNGATCDAANITGCAAQTPPQVPVGIDPISTAFDQATDAVYVTNWKDQDVSVINAARCNGTQTSGCTSEPTTITVGLAPSWTVVSLTLHTIYVLVQSTNSVAVLRG
jgi:DNA-binding beta-propeller fold protein YncE